MIWNFVINIINKAVTINPPNKLNLSDNESKIRAIPRYIGFLVKRKIPDITKWEALEGWRGFTVVLYFLNEATARKNTNNPRNKKMVLNTLIKLELYSGNKDLEKKIISPEINVTIGGGILLFI